jgi:putative transposase
VSATPQHTIPKIVKMLKGISARKLFLKFPQLKKKLWGGHLWNPSYFVSTVSENTEAQVKKYIENQNAESEKSRAGVPPVEGTFKESI